MTPTILALLLAAGLPVPPQASQLPPWYHWLFEAFRPAGGGAGTILTVTGVSPLALVNALAGPLHSLTQYGKCVQDGTPTPSAPVDILCNNGAIKVSLNLANMVSGNIVVGKYINNSGVETSDTANFYYATFIPVTPGETYTMSTSSSIWYFSVMQYDSSKNFLRRTIWGATNTPVGTEKSFSVGSDCAYIRFGSNMRKATITEADVLAVDWMLTQTATAQDFRPYGEIYTDGEDEVLTVGGQNLVDLTAVTDDFYYDPNGVYTAVSNARLTDYIPVRAGQKYTVYVKAVKSGTSANVRCNLFDSAKVWISQSAFTVNSGAEAVSVITPAQSGYLRVSANYTGAGAKVDWSVLQIVRGEYTLATMPPYEPYVAPQTVTDIPMLLGVGDYKDSAEIISGIKTGKVGIKVMTGDADERWGYSQTSGFDRMNLALPDMLSANYGQGLCTHLERVNSVAEGIRFGASNSALYVYLNPTRGFSSAELWKAFLAAQYAAGTPVIVVYQLATETTEQTTPHSLHSYNGTTIVDVESPVDPVELRAEYKGVST